jgi:hypothetical protein
MMMQPGTKQAFFTLDSRLTLQRGNVYQKKVKYSDARWDRFVVFMLLFLFLLFTLYQIIEEEKYGSIAQLILIVFWLSPRVKSIYQTLFVKTWKSIIPLKDVKGVSTKQLENGLETEVSLHLSSGRRKVYTFRNAEAQIEPFVEAVSAHIAVPAHAAL